MQCNLVPCASITVEINNAELGVTCIYPAACKHIAQVCTRVANMHYACAMMYAQVPDANHQYHHTHGKRGIQLLSQHRSAEIQCWKEG